MGFETFCSVICFTTAIVCQIGLKAHNAGMFDKLATKFTRFVVTRIERLEERNI